ncbi:hypothetical protein HCN44_001938 [Aphidius gifuensis]|uniref:Adenylyl-sulfate kinase n=1 Tax=Aphidius gifuensis TaxID=684658 RepID=A0A834Y1M0_APHGI|nr:hypothetical protein HCN44_001938 [Aphidius gifuensis]
MISFNMSNGLSNNIQASSNEKNIATNVTKQLKDLSRNERGQIIGCYPGFRGCTVWMTGLSGAGKTSIAFQVEKYLVNNGIPAYGLDGDNMRTGLNKNLGFKKEDREENIRRVSEVAKLFADSGYITLCSFVSPFSNDRNLARIIHEDADLPFFEIFVDASLNTCEARDVKGLYKKVRQGTIKSFTGIDQTYEIPNNPDLVIDTETENLEKSCMRLIEFLKNKSIIPDNFNLSSQQDNFVDELFITGDRLELVKNEASTLKPVELSELDVQWLQILSEGWAAPLKGFMNEQQYLQSLHFNCLFENGATINQSIPIVLAINTELKESLKNEKSIVLKYQGKNLAIMRNPEFYYHRKEERCSRQFGTKIIDVNTRKKLLDRGYKKPLLLLHPLGGWTKDDDVPLKIRIKQHQAVLEENILHNDTLLAIFPSPMMYAGPTEVQWHAKTRMTAGANFYIVGRDPAGIPHPIKTSTPDGNLYDPMHGSQVLSMAPGLHNLEIIPFRVAAYDTKKKIMAFFDHNRKEDFDFISGTKMRGLAKSGETPPEGFMAPSAWKILAEFYKNLTNNNNYI